MPPCYTRLIFQTCEALQGENILSIMAQHRQHGGGLDVAHERASAVEHLHLGTTGTSSTISTLWLEVSCKKISVET